MRGVDLQRAFGTPYWSGPRGKALGDSSTTTTLDPSVLSDGGIISNPGGYPGLTPSGPPSWLQPLQLGVQDAFSFAKLFNPVPPGTVMQTGPNGTYIARAADGQATPGYFPSVGASGFGWGTMLLIGGVIFLIVASKGRG